MFDTPYDDRAVGGSLKLTGEPWAGGRLGVAGHLRRDRHDETPNTLPGRETPTYRFEDLTTSLGVELDQALSPELSLTLGVARQAREAGRAPDQQRGGASFPLGRAEATDLQAGLSWRPTDGGAWFGGVARKSRFASQFERYSYRLGAALPNPELEAERATHWQIDWRGKLRNARLKAALFRINLDGRLSNAGAYTVFAPTNAAFEAASGGQARAASGGDYVVPGRLTAFELSNACRWGPVV